MITKEEFIKFITSYKEFESAIDRIEKAVCGRRYGCNLFESDWYEAVGKMLDIFLDLHFTESGSDWITYYLFEDVKDKTVIVTNKDIFNEEIEVEYHLNSIDELWEFLLSDINLYFKNV